MVFNSVLLKGSFDTNISSVLTKVNFKIYNDYKIKATFNSHGENYTFKMERWIKTKEGTKDPKSSFDKFYNLLFSHYGDISDMFGSVEKSEIDGMETITRKRTEENIKNVLIYAMTDVFVCAEQIISAYKRSLLDYCIYFRELSKDSTYEEYIHLVACHCLVYSNYLAPGVKYEAVEFVEAEREYNHGVFSKVRITTESDDEKD